MTDILDEEPAVPKTTNTPLPDLPELDDDDELDSFFKKKSKKDKKKKKKKNKEGSGEKEADGASRPSKKKDDSQSNKDDKKDGDNVDEWNDFEDESMRDYSDLKIQNMQITEEPLPTNEPEPEYNEDGELIPPKAEQGPWNKARSSPVETQSDIIDTPVVEEPKKGMGGAYRPPGLRSAGGGGAYRPPGMRGGDGGNLAPMRRNNRASAKAPEISDEMAFPSLSSAAADTESHKGFEVVKNTGAKSVQAWRSKRVATANSEVRLGNQFSALSSGR